MYMTLLNTLNRRWFNQIAGIALSAISATALMAGAAHAQTEAAAPAATAGEASNLATPAK
jgi:hypothetical protein